MQGPEAGGRQAREHVQRSPRLGRWNQAMRGCRVMAGYWGAPISVAKQVWQRGRCMCIAPMAINLCVYHITTGHASALPSSCIAMCGRCIPGAPLNPYFISSLPSSSSYPPYLHRQRRLRSAQLPSYSHSSLHSEFSCTPDSHHQRRLPSAPSHPSSHSSLPSSFSCALDLHRQHRLPSAPLHPSSHSSHPPSLCSCVRVLAAWRPLHPSLTLPYPPASLFLLLCSLPAPSAPPSWRSTSHFLVLPYPLPSLTLLTCTVLPSPISSARIPFRPCSAKPTIQRRPWGGRGCCTCMCSACMFRSGALCTCVCRPCMFCSGVFCPVCVIHACAYAAHAWVAAYRYHAPSCTQSVACSCIVRPRKQL